MRRFNWIFFVVLVAMVGVVGVGLFFVHGRQVQSQAQSLLQQARSAEAEGDLDQAIEHLRRYLQFDRNDAEAWVRYARLIDRPTTVDRRGRQQIFQVMERALQFAPEDETLRRRCADLAMGLGNFSGARWHLDRLLESADPSQAAERAELETLIGRCEAGLSRFNEAESRFRKALELDPGQLDASVRLARLLRDRLQRPEAADAVIAQMVEADPDSGLARLRRWQYQEQYGLEADPEDVAAALRAEPDDPEVRLAAAIVAERREDIEAARNHLRHAIERNPDRSGLYLAASSLELRQQDPEQAVAILEDAVEALPDDLEVRFLLADALIGRMAEAGEEAATAPAAAEPADGESIDAMILNLKDRGLAEGFLNYLEGRLLFVRGQWKEAIPRINTARQRLASAPDLLGRLELMLAECQGRLGLEDQQLAILQQAAERESTAQIARLELARRLEGDGNPEAALMLHLMLLEDRPESQLDVVRLLIQQNLSKPSAQRNWREAEERLVLAERTLPDQKTEADLLRIDLLLAQGNTAEAREALEALGRRVPEDPRVLIVRSRMKAQQGDEAAALDLLAAAEQEAGRSLPVELERIASWTRQGDDQARAALSRMAAQVADRPIEERLILLDALAVALLRLGDVEQSRALWKQMAEDQPDNIRLRMVLIDLALAADDTDEVRGHVDVMRRVEGPDGLLWRYAEATLMLNLAGKGDPNALRLARDRAREINTRSAGWWGSYAINAQIAEREGQVETATQNYLRAVERGANQPSLARRLVGLLYQQQQFDTIDRVVDLLEQRNAGLADLSIIEAMNALRRGEVDRGIALARRILPEDSTNPVDHLFIGRMMVYSGRFEEAEPVLKRALELGRADPMAWISYAQCLLGLDQADRVRELLAEAPEAVAADQQDLTVARLHELLGDVDEARDAYERAVEQRPEDIVPLRSLIEFTVRTGDTDRANPLLDRLQDPRLRATEADLAWANRMRSMMLLQTGDLTQVDEALEIVRSNLDENPYSFDDQKMRAILLSMRPSRRQESIDALQALDNNRNLEPSEQFLLAMLHLAGGDGQEARNVLTRIVENPISRDPRPLITLVNLLIDQENLDEASRRIEQLRPLLGEVLQQVALEARLLKERGDDPGAIALIERYAESHPDQIGAIASLFEQLDFPDQAEASYRAFVKEAPDEPTRAIPLAAFLAQQARTDEALALCEAIRPDVPPLTLAELAVSTLALNPEATDAHNAQVEQWLLDALSTDPDSGGLLVQHAVFRTLQEDFPRAESLYRDALRRDPNNLQALNNLAWLLGFRAPNGTEALSLIEQAIERAGPIPALLDTRAVLRLKQGQVDPALDDLRIALANAPEVPQLHFHLAWAQLQAGNPAEAVRAFQMAEDLGLKRETVDPLERDEFDRIQTQIQPREDPMPR